MVSKAYEYDANGNMIKEQDGMGYSQGYGTEYTYNLANQKVTILDPEASEKGLSYTVKYEYDGAGRKVSETNAKGAITGYHYDDASRITRITIKRTEDALEQTLLSNEYDLMGNKISETDALGNKTTFEYNTFSKVTEVAYPTDETISKNTVSFQYDVMGRVKRRIDTSGTEDIYHYDSQGRELSHTQQFIDGGQAITSSTLYDKNGNVVYEIDPNGTVTENKYDQLNRLIETKVAVTRIDQVKTERITKYEYDKNGNVTKETDWRGNEYTLSYDSLDRLVQKQDPYATIQTLEYNLSNAQTKSIDALGNITIFQYDKNNRLTETIDPEGHVTENLYDELGNIIQSKDGLGNKTTYEYDYLNRLSSVVNAKGETTKYTYDLNGNMLTQEDGEGNITTYEYNVVNKPIRRIDHEGKADFEGAQYFINSKVESYTYYPNGLLKTKTDRNEVTTTYSYDCHQRLIQETAGYSTINYTSDNNGNQLVMTDSTGSTVRTYDELGRVTMKIVPDIGTTVFTYDIIDSLTAGHTQEKTEDPKGNVTVNEYDKVGRLIGVTANNQTTVYAYDTNGNKTKVTYPDGSKEEYTYNKDNLLNTLTNTKSDGTVIDTYTYTYDAAHNQISKQDAKGVTNYTYDSLNRLQKIEEPASLGGKTTVYEYDKAGNRTKEIQIQAGNITKTQYTYNNQNRLTETAKELPDGSKEVTKYSYDNNGNMIYKSLETTKIKEDGDEPQFGMFIEGQAESVTVLSGVIEIFKYDEFNQMIANITGNQQANYQYNGEGLRVSKTIGDKTIRYLYEYDKVILELDKDGDQIAKNVYGSNLINRTVEGKTAYYMYNGHGDVTALLDSTTGTILASYYYDAFGNPIEETGTINNPYRYAGYQYDEESDLYYLNARYYDPTIARFMTEDTYRGQANDPLSLNLYTYCHNEPLMYYDPTGHWEEGDDKLSDVQQAAIIQLSNEWFEAETPEERDEIHKQAMGIRSGKISPDTVLVEAVNQETLAQQVKSIMKNPKQETASKKSLEDSEIGVFYKSNTGENKTGRIQVAKSINEKLKKDTDQLVIKVIVTSVESDESSETSKTPMELFLEWDIPDHYKGRMYGSFKFANDMLRVSENIPTHEGLDAIGAIDLGAISPADLADIINFFWYTAEGDYENADISFIAIFVDPSSGVRYVDEAGRLITRGSNETAEEFTEVVVRETSGLAASIKWKGFKKGELAIHYQKHVVDQMEFGSKISQSEYLKQAKNFAFDTSSSFKEEMVGNFIVKYDPSSRRVLIGHSKAKEIRTFYIANDSVADPFQAAIDLAKQKSGTK